MRINFSDIKNFFKERKKDIIYILLTIFIVGLMIFSLVFSVRAVLKAIEVMFLSEPTFSEVSSFNFKDFEKIAPRLGIDFSLKLDQVPKLPVKGNQLNSAVNSTSTLDLNKTTTTQDSASIQEENILKEKILNQTKINILNGTNIKGLASLWKKKFISEGFKEENIEVANAKEKDYQEIIIYVLSSDSQAAEVLAQIFKKFNKTNLSIKQNQKLASNEVLIILGQAAKLDN